MRLYRGLTKPYRSELVKPLEGRLVSETDFTDCPHAALKYAAGSRGVVLVLEVPATALDTKVTEELWPGAGAARRFIAWGTFDKFLVGQVPAKDLRARIRGKPLGYSSDAAKSQILREAIERLLGAGARIPEEG